MQKQEALYLQYIEAVDKAPFLNSIRLPERRY